MKFSVNTNTFRNSHTPEQIVKIAVEAGADGLEWGINSLEKAAAEAREMRLRTDDAGLEILSFINGGKLWKTDDIRRWSEAVAPAGAKMLRVAHPWYAWNYEEELHQPLSFNELLDRTREGLDRLQNLSREFGIRYVLETHRGSCFASPLAVKIVMEGFDPKTCGVIYDPANTFLEGLVRPRGAVEVMGEYLAYVHAKNLMITETPEGEISYEKRPMDHGIVNYEEVMFALKLAGYDGWFSLEEFYSEPKEVVTEIRHGIAHLKDTWSRVPDCLQKPYLTLND